MISIKKTQFARGKPQCLENPLKRMGMKKKPFYRVSWPTSAQPRDAAFIEEIGSTTP
jgi:ribosomal protein S16